MSQRTVVLKTHGLARDDGRSTTFQNHRAIFQHLTGMAAVFLQLSRLASSVTVNAPSVWALVALKQPG